MTQHFLFAPLGGEPSGCSCPQSSQRSPRNTATGRAAMASAGGLGKRKRAELCIVCGDAHAEALQAECGHVVTCFPCAFRIFAEDVSAGSLTNAAETRILGNLVSESSQFPVLQGRQCPGC